MKFRKLYKNAITPTRNNEFDAGLDLYAYSSNPKYGDVKLPGQQSSVDYNDIYNGVRVQKISTGIAVQIPKGYVGLICDRSGLGSNGIKVFGGVIDSGYNGEILVCLGNTNAEDYTIPYGKAIAQLVILPILLPKLEEVENFEQTERGENGFGSSDKLG